MKQTSMQFGAVQLGIILLTVATAVMHLTLAFPSVMFILNGLGYLVLLAALYAPLPQLAPYRNIVRWVLIGYTLLTIILWLFIGFRGTYAYINKTIEVLLVVLLWVEHQGQS